jgi:predicted nucleic acid-binding protein
MKRIFVDTNIFRYASEVKVIQKAKKSNGRIHSPDGEVKEATFVVYDSNIKPPKYQNQALENEVSAIRRIADLASDGKIELLYSHEVNLELFFQPLVDIFPGRLHGAPCKLIHSPLLKGNASAFNSNDITPFPFKDYPVSRYNKQNISIFNSIDQSVIEEFLRDNLLSIPIKSFIQSHNFRHLVAVARETTGYVFNAAKLLFPLLNNIQDERYKTILSTLNMGSASEEKKANLFLDAYHLWTAETSHCNFFLTMDNAIVNQYRNNNLGAVKPQQFLFNVER